MYKILLALCLVTTSLHSMDKKELTPPSHRGQQQPINLKPLDTFLNTHINLVENKLSTLANYSSFKEGFNPQTGKVPVSAFMAFVGDCEVLFNKVQGKLCESIGGRNTAMIAEPRITGATINIPEHISTWREPYATEIYPAHIKPAFDTFQAVTNRVFQYWEKTSTYTINPVAGVIKDDSFPYYLSYISDSGGYIPSLFLGTEMKPNTQYIQSINYGGDAALLETICIYTVYNGKILPSDGWYIRKNPRLYDSLGIIEATHAKGVYNKMPFTSNDVWVSLKSIGIHVDLGNREDLFIPTTFKNNFEEDVVTLLLLEELEKERETDSPLFPLLLTGPSEPILAIEFNPTHSESENNSQTLALQGTADLEEKIKLKHADHIIKKAEKKKTIECRQNQARKAAEREAKRLEKKTARKDGSKRVASPTTTTPPKKPAQQTPVQLTEQQQKEASFNEYKQKTRTKYRGLLTILGGIAKTTGIDGVKKIIAGSHMNLHGEPGTKGMTIVKKHGTGDTTIASGTANTIIKKFIDFTFSQKQ